MNNRQLQAKATKEHIMGIAKILSQKYSYDELSVDLICKKAGVSTGAFYHHFKSKQGLIIEGYGECDNFFRENIIGKLESKDPLERILEYIDCQMKYAIEIGIDLMIEVYKTQITEGSNFFLQSSRGLPQGLQALVEEAQEIGIITKSQSSESIASELLLIARGVIYNWCQNNGVYELRPYCHNIIINHIHCFKV
ncbi:MAG: TetR/AcrR family transcriptional regulator [Clostridium sp.]|uniref:TetR/AcrR family transcriptional regulator n=1 Tax=Clostridium sp. TaxID=1506 RepID=UPI003D6CC0F0